jgi:hypothetical protein
MIRGLTPIFWTNKHTTLLIQQMWNGDQKMPIITYQLPILWVVKSTFIVGPRSLRSTEETLLHSPRASLPGPKLKAADLSGKAVFDRRVWWQVLAKETNNSLVWEIVRIFYQIFPIVDGTKILFSMDILSNQPIEQLRDKGGKVEVFTARTRCSCSSHASCGCLKDDPNLSKKIAL